MLSARLEASAKYLKGFNYLVDCGTDHGYLPIYAIKNNLVKKAIASDNKELPLNNAKKNIKAENLNIKTILADGLPFLTEEIDIISILGMGGRLIKDILSRADLSNVKRMVLSANSESNILRDYLENNHFKIVAEEFIEDKQKYYQIIVCEPGKMTLNDIQKEFGPINIKNNNDVFKEYINKLIKNLEKAILNVKDELDLKNLKLRIKTLKEVVS